MRFVPGEGVAAREGGPLLRLAGVAAKASWSAEVLAIYAYGTHTGIRSVIGAGSAHSEEEIRYVRRHYLSPQVAQRIAVEIANATFAARDTGVWGASSTAVASDSTRFRSWTRTCSPSGTRATAGAGSWCTGTSSAGRWWCTARP